MKAKYHDTEVVTSDGRSTSKDIFILTWIKKPYINTLDLELKPLTACWNLT